jgi:hypothetical protein
MDEPDSSNQAAEAAPCDGHSAPVARLAALAMHLATRGLDVDVTRDGLLTRAPDRPGTAHPITCRPRPEDAGRLWFFVGTAETPIAEADQIIEAALAVCALLATGDGGGDRG